MVWLGLINLAYLFTIGFMLAVIAPSVLTITLAMVAVVVGLLTLSGIMLQRDKAKLAQTLTRPVSSPPAAMRLRRTPPEEGPEHGR